MSNIEATTLVPPIASIISESVIFQTIAFGPMLGVPNFNVKAYLTFFMLG